jgi:hypothetical protein
LPDVIGAKHYQDDIGAKSDKRTFLRVTQQLLHAVNLIAGVALMLAVGEAAPWVRPNLRSHEIRGNAILLEVRLERPPEPGRGGNRIPDCHYGNRRLREFPFRGGGRGLRPRRERGQPEQRR